MKRKMIGVLMVLLMVFGLVACDTTPQVVEAITEIAARRLAQHLAFTHPELVIPGTVLCDQILGENDEGLANALLDQAINKSIGKIAGTDPLLRKDIKSILKLVNLDLTGGWINEVGVDTSKFDMVNLKLVAQAIKDGLNAPMLQYVEK